MNKSYRSIWNEALGAWVAASELTKGRGKSGSSKALAGVLVTALMAGPAMAGALDGGTVNGAGQLAYGPGASAGAVPGGSNVIVIGDGVDTSVATATDAIAIGTQLRNNAASSILMGNNGVELDAGSARSVVFSPEATGGTAGTKWAQPVTGSADSFVFVSNRSTNRITSSQGAVAIGGSVLNATDGVAIGTSSSTTYADGVALGSGSKTAATLAGLTAAYNPSGTAVGTTPVGELSIGNAAGAKRRITNVAAGGADTDAVNVSQLKATDTNVTNLTTTVSNVSTTLNNAVNGGGIKYFHANSTAVDSQAIGLDSIAIGPQAVAGKQNAFAAGTRANASGEGAIAIGDAAQSTALNTTALGRNSQAIAEEATALGFGASATESTSTAVGFNARATAIAATAVGDGARASGTWSTALGHSANASAPDATALGHSATASGNGTAVGVQSGAGSDATAVGVVARASGIASTAVGYFSEASGERSAAFGRGTASGSNALALGWQSRATDQFSVAIGDTSVSSGPQSIAIGNGAQASGLQSISIGTGNVVSGNNSGAFGDPSIVNGASSYSVGNGNTVATNATFVLGNNVTATTANGLVLGSNSASTRGAIAAVANPLLMAGQPSTGNNNPATITSVGEVSVGAAGATRQITNVAGGTQDTDAVNVGQIKPLVAAVSRLSRRYSTRLR